MDEYSLLTRVLFGAVIALAGLVHGTLGMGFPVVATPLLALLVDVRVAILITLLPTVTVNVASIVKGGNWGDSLGRYWPLALWVVAGSLAGSKALVVLDPAPFKLVLAMLVLLYLATSRWRAFGMRWVRERRAAAVVLFGLVAGLSAGTTNVMVPILIIFALELGLARTAMVQVFNLCFLAGKVSQIGVFTAAGLFTVPVALGTVPFAVVAALGLAVGMRLRERIPVAVYLRIVNVLLLVIALVLVGQYAAGR